MNHTDDLELLRQFSNTRSEEIFSSLVHRYAPLVYSVGTNGVCDGAFSQDLNARWCPTCPKPSHTPVAGQKLQLQLWYRDPQNTSNQTTSLSNALELDVCP